MIEIDNKVYRNIPEQVGKNKDDIELLKKAYGYHGPFASKDDIDNPVDQALYLIGTAYPYEIYQYKELTNTYLDLGPFAAAGAQGPAGPQGPQGPQGIPGEKGDSVDAYTKEETNTLLNDKADKSTTYTKNTVDALFNKRFWNWKFENDSSTNKGSLYHGEDTIISNNYDEFSGYIIGDWNTDYLLTGMSDRPKYSNSADIKDIALLEDVNKKANSSDVYTKSETYTKTETDTLLNGKYDVKEFTIEKGSIGDEIGTSDFFNYLITTGFNSGQYLNKICRFSYVDTMDLKYEYLVIPTYYDASSNYSDLTVISDGGVYKAYISEEDHEITPYIDDNWLYNYCGNLQDLQTKKNYDLVGAINEVNAIAKANTDSLYSYVLDTTIIDIDKNIPSTVDIGGVTFDLVDKVKASFNRLGGQTVFDSNHLIKTDCPAYIAIAKRNFSATLILRDELAAIDSLLLASYSQYGQYLRGYSVNDSVYNYIDFANKKFIINCAERSYQAGDKTNQNVLTDSTRSIYKLETPIEVDISSIINDNSGITPPIEVNGGISGHDSNGQLVKCHKNVEFVYKKIKKNNLVKKLIEGTEGQKQL